MPTQLGPNELLPADDGWDPFLRKSGPSLWLLHWNLLKAPCDAAAWHYTFNQFRRVEFSQNDLFLAVSDYGQTLKKNIAESSINKDVSCILRMYVKQRSQTKVSEDSIDCPFTELGLIHTAGDSKYYTFRVNPEAEFTLRNCRCCLFGICRLGGTWTAHDRPISAAL